MFEGILDEFLQILPELIHSGRAAKGFVVAKKSKNDICFSPGEPIIRAAEVFAAHADTQFISSEPEVANGQVVVGEMGLDKCFKPAVVLHAIGKRVANDGDVVAVVE